MTRISPRGFGRAGGSLRISPRPQEFSDVGAFLTRGRARHYPGWVNPSAQAAGRCVHPSRIILDASNSHRCTTR